VYPGIAVSTAVVFKHSACHFWRNPAAYRCYPCQGRRAEFHDSTAGVRSSSRSAAVGWSVQPLETGAQHEIEVHGTVQFAMAIDTALSLCYVSFLATIHNLHLFSPVRGVWRKALRAKSLA
jgi:hypothetical protein